MIPEGGDYRLAVEGGRLRFRTPSFKKPAAASVLSSRVYGPELSAMLAAALPAVAAFLLFGGAGLWRYAAMFAGYASGFLFFRIFVFKKRFLALEMDRNNGEAVLKIPFRASEKFGTGEIEKVDAEHTVITPQNRDGLRMVEEMALHHFTVLPGLGEPVNFYTVRLHLKGRASGGIEIYSGRESRDAAAIVDEMRKFLFPPGSQF